MDTLEEIVTEKVGEAILAKIIGNGGKLPVPIEELRDLPDFDLNEISDEEIVDAIKGIQARREAR